nr:MAG: hypothetical protein [Bacteriophage sp.]
MTMTTTRRQIKQYGAIDATNFSYAEMKELIKNERPTVICVSSGTYGVNGAVFQVNGKLYKITDRANNLFMVL